MCLKLKLIESAAEDEFYLTWRSAHVRSRQHTPKRQGRNTGWAEESEGKGKCVGVCVIEEAVGKRVGVHKPRMLSPLSKS